MVDDHEVVRVGLKAILENIPGFMVTGEAATAAEAKNFLQTTSLENKPDVILLDVRLPGESGIDACQSILSRYHNVHIIMLTSYADEETVFQAIIAGADGYILKQTGSEDLVRAIRTVQGGGAIFDPETTRQVMRAIQAGRVPLTRSSSTVPYKNGTLYKVESKAQADLVEGLHELTEPLSDQEQRILSLIAEGKTNRCIAEDIYLSEKTVRNYVSNILGKLHLSNRAEAAAFAVRHGLAAGE